MQYWAALGLAVVANVGANILLAGAVREANPGHGGFALSVLRLPKLWGGLLLAGVLLLAYLYALRGIHVSIAYPATIGCALVGLVIADRMLFGVPLGLVKGAGIVAIILGLFMLRNG